MFSINGTTSTDYLGGFQYENNVLQFFPHAEGYVKHTPDKHGNPTFDYVYNYTDHLGNIRLSYTLDPVANVLKILEENHYYPFGLKHTNYNSERRNFIKETETDPKKVIPVLNMAYKYKYNGKEWQDELGLNFYDYGARNYDPAIGRWMNIDPLAHKYINHSPYNYTLNNPVFYIDPDGMRVRVGFNASTGVLTITDLDHYKKGLETVYVSASDYKKGGIRDEKGKLLKNQVLVIEGVFSGGHANGESVEQGDENGTEGNPKEVPVPNGSYDILDNKGGYNSHWYRLDAQDSYRYNDEHEQAQNKKGDDRKNFRFHLGATSHGCVTLNKNNSDRELEWNLITEIFNNTSTSEVPDRQGKEKFKPSTTRTNYGTMEITGSSINPKPIEKPKPIYNFPTGPKW